MSQQRRANQRLEALYRQIPPIACKGLCTDSCGPILMSPAEAARVRPPAAPAESQESLTCPLLINGRCSVYPVRPLICRLFGVIPSMPCPFGCEPERWLTEEESQAMMDMIYDDQTRPIGNGVLTEQQITQIILLRESPMTPD